jgi:hypothetical protein
MHDPSEKHARRSSNASSRTSTAPNKPTAPPSSEMMRKLWLWMSVLYSAKWSSASGETFGESGPIGQLWQQGLTGLTDAQIQTGMAACQTSGEPWPPGLNEFKAMCFPQAAPDFEPFKPQRADPAKLPSPERLQWHKDNIAWIEKGGELPRPGVTEPPAPAGCKSFWSIYKGPDNRSAADKAQTHEPMSPEWL